MKKGPDLYHTIGPEWKSYYHPQADSDSHYHETKIGGHHVEVSFERHGGDKDHDVSFKVNHTVNNRGDVSAATGHKILRHVVKITKQFVAHRKPEELSFYGYDDNESLGAKKHKIYQGLARSKGQGAKITDVPGGTRPDLEPAKMKLSLKESQLLLQMFAEAFSPMLSFRQFIIES
jgi:hypothetical protein